MRIWEIDSTTLLACLSLSSTSPFDESEKDVFIQLIPLCVSLSIESEIDGDISVSELDSDVRLCM